MKRLGSPMQIWGSLKKSDGLKENLWSQMNLFWSRMKIWGSAMKV